MTQPEVPAGRTGLRGILAPVRVLDRGLFIVLLALLATCAARYLDRHGLGVGGLLIGAGAAALAIGYRLRTVLVGRAWWPTVWVLGLVVIWSALTIAAPSFAWCAVAIVFAVLQVLAYPWAVVTAVAMTVVAVASTWRISDSVDPTLVAGPIAIAIITVLAFRALDRESRARQDVLDQLAEEQQRFGALTERTRLSREIHDSVGQGLSSINLLLQAAEQDWDRRPEQARGHVATAAAAARGGLDEVRRVVRDLAPIDLDDPDGLIRALHDAATALPGLDTSVRVEGEPAAVRADIAGALVRTVRGALANVAEHADATRTVVTLTFHDDEVIVDVRDDGRGFDPLRVGSRDPLRGRGLVGIGDRARALGGEATIESAPGDGTTVSVRFPTPQEEQRA